MTPENLDHRPTFDPIHSIDIARVVAGWSGPFSLISDRAGFVVMTYRSSIVTLEWS